MKKLIKFILLLSLILSSTQLTFARLDQACNQACLQEIETGPNAHTPLVEERTACANACDDDTDPGISKAYLACMEVDTHENCKDILDKEPVENKLPDLIKPDNLPSPDIGNDSTGEDIQTYIRTRVLPKLASRLITIATIISIFMLIFSGGKFVTALGDETKIKEAKQTAIYAVVGLAVSLSSYLIISIINNISLS